MDRLALIRGDLLDQLVDRGEDRGQRLAIARQDRPGGERARAFLAEGVEEESQAYTLETLGVDTGQGWLFAKALSYADATTAIRTDQARQPPYTKPSH